MSTERNPYLGQTVDPYHGAEWIDRSRSIPDVSRHTINTGWDGPPPGVRQSVMRQVPQEPMVNVNGYARPNPRPTYRSVDHAPIEYALPEQRHGMSTADKVIVAAAAAGLAYVIHRWWSRLTASQKRIAKSWLWPIGLAPVAWCLTVVLIWTSVHDVHTLDTLAAVMALGALAVIIGMIVAACRMNFLLHAAGKATYQRVMYCDVSTRTEREMPTDSAGLAALMLEQRN